MLVNPSAYNFRQEIPYIIIHSRNQGQKSFQGFYLV